MVEGRACIVTSGTDVAAVSVDPDVVVISDSKIAVLFGEIVGEIVRVV